MKLKRKLKRIFNLYNVAIFVCIILIGVSVYIIFRPDKTQETSSGSVSANANTNSKGVEVVKTNTKEADEISEQDARKAAKKQFKELGEDVKEDELNCIKIERAGEEYYYITSANNTLENKIKGGKIERINSVLVEGN